MAWTRLSALFFARKVGQVEDRPWGGRSGYVADPDEHAWEIAWNPSWPIDADGHVTFKT